MQGMRIATGCFILCVAMYSYGDDALRVFISGPNSEALSRFSESLFSGSDGVLALADTPSTADVTILVGDDHFNRAPPDVPVVGIEVTRDGIDRRRAAGCRCSGLYSGAAPADQLALLRALLPGARRIGVILPAGASAEARALEAAAVPQLELTLVEADSTDQLPQVLARLLPHVDALLLLPAPALFNADTARLLLLTSYRQGRPVIGPDEAFVRAGSLASVHASSDDLVEAIITMLSQYTASGTLPAPRYAARSVAVNRHVARAYGVLDADVDALQQTLWGQP